MKIDYVQAYRYLGVTFDEHLSFNEVCQELIDAGGRALGGIIVKFKQYKHKGFNCFTKLFETGVEPVCTYGSGIWGCDKFLLGQKIQLRALRYFLCVHKQTPTVAIKGASGWLNMKYKNYLNMLKYYNRLLTMPSDQLTHQAFESDLHHITNNNWCGNVEKILQILNKEEILRNHETIKIDTVRKALEYINNKEFQQKILYKPKLRLYKNSEELYCVTSFG